MSYNKHMQVKGIYNQRLLVLQSQVPILLQDARMHFT